MTFTKNIYWFRPGRLINSERKKPGILALDVIGKKNYPWHIDNKHSEEQNDLTQVSEVSLPVADVSAPTSKVTENCSISVINHIGDEQAKKNGQFSPVMFRCRQSSSKNTLKYSIKRK